MVEFRQFLGVESSGEVAQPGLDVNRGYLLDQYPGLGAIDGGRWPEATGADASRGQGDEKREEV